MPYLLEPEILNTDAAAYECTMRYWIYDMNRPNHGNENHKQTKNWNRLIKKWKFKEEKEKKKSNYMWRGKTFVKH